MEEKDNNFENTQRITVKSTSSSIAIFISIACLILIIFSLGIMYYKILTLKGTIDDLKSTINSNSTKKIYELENKVNQFKKDLDVEKERLDNFSYLLNSINKSVILIKLGLEVTEGVVTDKVIIQKATFYEDAENRTSCTIDIRPQPSYSRYFLGQGRFNLSDRELKAMLEELIVELNNAFKNMTHNLMEIDGEIIITQNNYSVAKYKDGKITLTGE